MKLPDVNGKTANAFYGICSALSFFISILLLVFSLYNVDFSKNLSELNRDVITTYIILCFCILLMLLSFAVQSYSNNKYISSLQKSLGSLPQENETLFSKLNFHVLVFKEITQFSHDMSHYLRYITVILGECIHSMETGEKVTQEKIDEICYQFDFFMITKVLSTLAYAAKTLTGDNCATCIKIINNKQVKTLYRDSISYRTRKKSDIKPNGELFLYDITDNTGFTIIADPRSQETFFACDNLNSLKEHYKNCNPNRDKLYNATIVIPIQANLSGNPRIENMEILGFLCCDNMRGGLENLEIKDFLASVADQLYNLLVLYDSFHRLTKQNGFENARLQTYGNWN